jgi:hypothetical protein
MKPIESVTIYFRNDPSVGIHSATFQMEVFIDPMTQGDDLNETRTKIADLYEYLEGDKPTWVRFDFEIEAENRADDERLVCHICGEDH